MSLIEVNIVYLYAALIVLFGLIYSLNTLLNYLINAAQNKRADHSHSITTSRLDC